MPIRAPAPLPVLSTISPEEKAAFFESQEFRDVVRHLDARGEAAAMRIVDKVADMHIVNPATRNPGRHLRIGHPTVDLSPSVGYAVARLVCRRFGITHIAVREGARNFDAAACAAVFEGCASVRSLEFCNNRGFVRRAGHPEAHRTDRTDVFVAVCDVIRNSRTIDDVKVSLYEPNEDAAFAALRAALEASTSVRRLSVSVLDCRFPIEDMCSVVETNNTLRDVFWHSKRSIPDIGDLARAIGTNISICTAYATGMPDRDDPATDAHIRELSAAGYANESLFASETLSPEQRARVKRVLEGPRFRRADAESLIRQCEDARDPDDNEGMWRRRELARMVQDIILRPLRALTEGDRGQAVYTYPGSAADVDQTAAARRLPTPVERAFAHRWFDRRVMGHIAGFMSAPVVDPPGDARRPRPDAGAAGAGDAPPPPDARRSRH